MLPFDETRFAPQLAELDRLRQSLDAHPLVIGWQDRLATDLMADAIHASTAMEGVPVTVEEVRRILAGDRPSSVSPENASLVTGYRDAMTYCQRRADDDVFTWSPELIKAIQDRVLAGRRDWGAGRYGKGRYIQNNKTGELIYTPPQEGVGRLMDELCSQMNNWDAHPALKSAWVHVALAAVHPFKDGNGRTARVLASLAMYRGEFKRREFTSLEEWWGRHRIEYDRAFSCLGAEFDSDADVTPFIEAHVNAQVKQIHVLQNVERVRRRVFDGILSLIARLGLPDRSNAALWEAFWDRVITRPYYVAVADVGSLTGTKDLRMLVTAGLLRAEGRTRGRHWRVGERFFPLLGAQFGLDPERSTRDDIVATILKSVVGEAKAVAESQTGVEKTDSLTQQAAVVAGRVVVGTSGGTTTTRP